MSLSERIESAEDELLTLKDGLVESTKELEAAPDEESLLAVVEEKSADIETKTATLAALKKAESALATKAVAVAAAPAVIQRVSKSPESDGSLLFQAGTIALIAHCKKQLPEQVIAERYADDDQVKATYNFITTKTAVNPAATNVVGWAEELVRDDVRGFLDTLMPVSIAANLAGRSQRLSFDGANSITIPRMNPLGATLTEPAWVGENGVIPLTQFSFGSAKMERFKLAAISDFSMEIAERSTPQIEGLLRTALRNSYAQVLDVALLSAGAAVVGVRPAGLLHGVTQTAGTAGGGVDAVIGDIKTLIGAMIANQMGVRPVLIVNEVDYLSVSMMTSSLGEFTFRDETASGRLLGISVIASNNQKKGEIVMIDASALATAFDVPEFKVSDVATVTEANADVHPPTQSDDGHGALGTAGEVPPMTGGIGVVEPTGAASAGYTARSFFQTYSAGIRMVCPTTWALLRPNAVASIKAITW